MKTALSILTLSFSLSAQAGNWFCTASGYDSQNQEVNVAGDYMPTEAEAQRSAMDLCYRWSLRTCRVESCFNLETPSADPSSAAQNSSRP